MGAAVFTEVGTVSAVPITPLPDGYTRLKYIIAPAGSHINTLYKPNTNTRLEMDVHIKEFAENTATSGWGTDTSVVALYGVREKYEDSEGATKYKNRFSLFATDEGSSFEVQTDSSVVSHTHPMQARTTIKHDKNECVVGRESYGILDNIYGIVGIDFQSNYNLFLLARNQNGTADYKYNQEIWLYGVLIYDNDVLVREYVPGIDANGKVGMYDMVNNAFYQSASSVAFIAGEVC